MSWPAVAIGELVKIRGGGTPRRDNKEFFHGDIPWVTPKDMKAWEINDSQIKITRDAIEQSAASEIPSDTVLLVVRSGVLKHTAPVAINRRVIAINQDMKSLQCNGRLLPEYLARFLKDAEPTILSWVRATTADNYSIDKIRELPIPLPSLDEQRRIAAILDQADELRRKRREPSSKCDKLAHAIYRDYFGDPVANTLSHSATTIGAMNVEMEYGPRFYNEAYREDGTRIVRITDLTEAGELDFDAMPRLRISESDLEKHRTRPGELLFARTGATVGKLALVSPNDPVCIPGAYFIRLRFPDSIDPTKSIQAIIFEGSRQSAQQNFSGPGLRRLPFIVPPIDLQRAFAARVAEIDKLKAQQRAHLEKLDALFASLQHRAFRGEL